MENRAEGRKMNKMMAKNVMPTESLATGESGAAAARGSLTALVEEVPVENTNGNRTSAIPQRIPSASLSAIRELTAQPSRSQLSRFLFRE
jgi:hypothetical protein